MKKLNLILAAGILAGMGGVAEAAKPSGATGSIVIDDSVPRRGPGTTSGSGDTVEANCAVDPGGNAWQEATAYMVVSQKGAGSKVEIEVEDAVPNTLFTVWLRIKGGAGFNDLGSPLTGGGATPLAPGTALDGLNEYSPWGSMPEGSADATNGFTTNARGKGQFEIDLDFPMVGGAYPFQATATSRPGHEDHANVPTAIVDPRTGNGGPFMIRIISHCTDQLGHGLSPGTREAWFQYP